MRSWLWSKIKKRLPRIIDSTQVNHAVVGQDKPWYFSERRFLVFGRRGPWELVIKPSHVSAFAMLFSTSVFALGYLSVQTLNTAFSVANQELISPADASLITTKKPLGELDRIEDTILGAPRALNLGPRKKEQSISDYLFSMKVRDIRSATQVKNVPENDDDWHEQPTHFVNDGVELGEKLNEISKFREQMLSSFEKKNFNSELEEIQIVIELPKFEKNSLLLLNQKETAKNKQLSPLKANALNHLSLVAPKKANTEETPEKIISEIAQDQDSSFLFNRPGQVSEGELSEIIQKIEETKSSDKTDFAEGLTYNPSMPNDVPLAMNETVSGARFLKSIDRELRVIVEVFERLGIELKTRNSLETKRVNLKWPMEPGSEDYLEYMRQQFVELDIYRDALASLPLQSPMKYYYISSNYGKRKHPVTKKWAMHHGIDLAGTWQEKVRATADGKVVFSGWEGSFGRVVRIQHRFGIETVYAHLARLSVKKGDYVTSGDILGSMGSSGRSDGAHLHYEIRVNSESKNPKKFFDVGQSLLSPSSLRLTAYQ